MIFGERIKQLRGERQWTQEYVCEKLNISNGALSRYETGMYEPKSLDLVKDFANLFNVSTDYLLGLTSYKNPKKELEKKLFALNLTEAEFTFLVKMFNESDAIDISIYYIQNTISKNPYNNRENIILNTVLEIVLDYMPNVEDSNDNQSLNALNKQIELNLLKIKDLINSLDKSKIIHNYHEVSANNWINTNKYKEEIHQDGSISYSDKFYMCPVYGQISAGIPNWAEECIEGRIPIDPVLFDIVDPEEHFFLRVNGESMNKVIRNGAYALIHKQDTVENGEIAVVLVNGDEATLKKFSKQGDLVVLEPMSNDNSFQVQVYDKNTPIRILGKYIGKFEMK